MHFRGHCSGLAHSDTRQTVREAASAALAIMAKTSDVTRGYIFPALLRSLENPCSEALPLIAKGKPDHIPSVP